MGGDLLNTLGPNIQGTANLVVLPCGLLYFRVQVGKVKSHTDVSLDHCIKMGQAKII